MSAEATPEAQRATPIVARPGGAAGDCATFGGANRRLGAEAVNEASPEARRLSRQLARLLACDPVRAADLTRFPREAGVYAFDGDSGRALYVGKAKTGLRNRMREHTWPSAEELIATRSSAPFCTLARHLAAEALGGRKVTLWPPPPRERKAVLEALAEVRGLRVRYIATPQPDRLALEALEAYARLRPVYDR